MSGSKKHINPNYSRIAGKDYSLKECIEGLPHNRQILSWLISKAENQNPESLDFLNHVLSATKGNDKVRRLAVSGSPGVGKSTFLNSIGQALIADGKQIAILPVDPTSYLSQGSILGDKTRMDGLVGRAEAYIKPMASSLALGGIAPSTHMAMQLCERAGFDEIYIETVGVGQSEYEVRHLVDLFILLVQPGSGDELQGIKRGIMEMADLLIVTKADGDLNRAAKDSVQSHRQAVKMLLANDYDWSPEVLAYSSVTHESVEQVKAAMQDFCDHMSDNNRLEKLRQTQIIKYFDDRIDDAILAVAKNKPEVELMIKALRQKLEQGEVLPNEAINLFKKQF